MIDRQRVKELRAATSPAWPQPHSLSQALPDYLAMIEAEVKDLADHMATVDAFPRSALALMSARRIEEEHGGATLLSVACETLRWVEKLEKIEKRRLKTRGRVTEHREAAARIKTARETLEKFLAGYVDAEEGD